MKTIRDNRKPIKAYQWDLLTMEYSGEISCIPDNLDASRWQIPGNATTQEPPAKRKGYIRKWAADKSKWVQSKVKK